MPYVDNDGTRIHYHVEGDGHPLVLQHGFTRSIENWYAYGYVDALKSDCQLILIDARGHGRSDKPHDPAAYRMDLRASDVMSVLDDLGIDTAHYWGYSMGGRIGFGIAVYSPKRVESLIIGGMHPFELNVGVPIEDRVRPFINGIEAWVANQEEQSGPIDPDHRGRLLKNDHKALIASIRASGDIPGIEETISGIEIPTMLYVGESDGFYPGVRNASEIIPGVTYVSFPGMDHGEVPERSELVLPHVTKFLSEVAS